MERLDVSNCTLPKKIQLTRQNENFENCLYIGKYFCMDVNFLPDAGFVFLFPRGDFEDLRLFVGFDMTDMVRINYSGGGAGEGGACRCQTLGFMSPLLAAWQPEKRLCRIAALLMLLTM